MFLHSAEVCLTADLLQTDGILYKIISSPCIAFRVDIVGCTGQSGNDVQAFPARIAALSPESLPVNAGSRHRVFSISLLDR